MSSVLNLYPTNNTVKVFRTGKPDRWGVIGQGTEVTEHDCIVLENTKLDKVPAGMDKYEGKEVTFNATVYFPELVKVKADDFIEYTDGFGELQKRPVIQVQTKRDFGGNILTVKAYV